VSTSNAAIKPKALALNPRFPIKPTLGRRIHFVYCISDLWLSKYDAARAEGSQTPGTTIR
jgi:hypothetical protein